MSSPRPPELDSLTQEVSEAEGTMDSAITLINGIQTRIDTAVAAALAANPGIDLSALNDLSSALNNKSNELAAAVAANPGPSARGSR